jgi:hypothetical protein
MVVPRLLALLLCHRVSQDDDGRPVLHGLYDRVVLRAVPGMDDCVVYTKFALPPGDHDLTLAIVDLETGRETGRAVHRVMMTAERSVHETTWSVNVRYERLGAYLFRLLADGELLGFTTVDVVCFPLVDNASSDG